MRKGSKEPGSNCYFLNPGIESRDAENLVKLLNQESSSFQGGSVVNQEGKATHVNIVNPFSGINWGQESNGTCRDKVIKIDNNKYHCEHKKPSWRQKKRRKYTNAIKDLFVYADCEYYNESSKYTCQRWYEPEKKHHYNNTCGNDKWRETKKVAALMDGISVWRREITKKICIVAIVFCVFAALLLAIHTAAPPSLQFQNLKNLKGSQYLAAISVIIWCCGTSFLLTLFTLLNALVLQCYGRTKPIFLLQEIKHQFGATKCYRFTVYGERWDWWVAITSVLLPVGWFLPIWIFVLHIPWHGAILNLLIIWLFVYHVFWGWDGNQLVELMYPKWSFRRVG